MRWDKNPFQELYLSDSVSEEAFVELFSPVPLTSAINPLFQEGNVVLTGTQGCGKSMILRLFFPETRIAYATLRVPFPVADTEARFVSAGVNLVKSSLCDVGQVTLGFGDEHDINRLPYFFGDFFNYWLIQDLFANLRKIEARPDVFGNIVHANHGKAFARCVAKQDCWFGLFQGCSTLEDFERRIARRIEKYRKWVLMNQEDRSVPDEIATTKTAIGEPIARTVECLKTSGLLDDDVKVFIRVDQVDELHQEATEHQRKIRAGFRQMLNRAFASRDMRIHYRIGTRLYGWNPEHLLVHGSGARLENRRDYLLVDLEETLRRKEASSGWRFPIFASDAFSRRVKYAFGLEQQPSSDLFGRIFGPRPRPVERAEKFGNPGSSRDQIDRILRLRDSENWSPKWTTWLRKLASERPLDAVLAAAWGRQTGGGSRKVLNREKPPPADNSWMKKWWRKERLMLAVLQLAARRSQRLLWWGSGDVIALSAPNITAFLHICHTVWDLFLKEQQLKPESERQNLLKSGRIREELQAAGIQSASRLWRDKLGEQPGGDVRRRFIDQLGRKLREQLRDDLAMSYPGANGFSLLRDELEDNHALWRFLSEAVSYGDLVATEHTTKNKSGEARIKYYLNPALSPVFQIPAPHTKEPLYWSVDDVLQIARTAELPFALISNLNRENEQKQTNGVKDSNSQPHLPLF